MKTVKIILIILLALLIGGSAVTGVLVLQSPHYALYKISKDVKAQGIDGLTPHLTGDAKTTVDRIQTVTQNPLLNSIISAITGEDALSVLKANAKDIAFSLEDVENHKGQAHVTLRFQYKETLAGTIELDMKKVDGDWKIYQLHLPDLNEIHF